MAYAGSDSLLKEDEYQAHPDLQMLPAMAGYVGTPVFVTSLHDRVRQYACLPPCARLLTADSATFLPEWCVDSATLSQTADCAYSSTLSQSAGCWQCHPVPDADRVDSATLSQGADCVDSATLSKGADCFDSCY